MEQTEDRKSLARVDPLLYGAVILLERVVQIWHPADAGNPRRERLRLLSCATAGGYAAWP